jgi:dTDP-4-dehydrorhamnose reductase
MLKQSIRGNAERKSDSLRTLGVEVRVKVMVLGASGMLGHVVTTVLEENEHEVVAVSRRGDYGALSVAVDLEDWSKLRFQIEKHSPVWVINAAGLLNLEVDRNPAGAILVNSFLPRKLAEVAPSLDFRLVTIGSDCVFRGDQGNYSIADIPDATSAYGRSKHLGEVNNERDLTIRTSIIGPEIDSAGRGLLQWFMLQDANVEGWSTAIWTGVSTLELAKVIESIVSGRLEETGLWHCVPSLPITKFDLLSLMNEQFRGSTVDINEVNGLSHDRSLVNDRPRNWLVPNYRKMMLEMHEWVRSHQLLYEGTVFEMDLNQSDMDFR